MGLQLVERLIRHATERPTAEAVRQIGLDGAAPRILTYQQVEMSSRALAACIGGEVGPGSVVLVCFPNQIECILSIVAALRAGATVFPVHPNLTDVELKAAALHSRAAGVIGSSRAVEVLRELGLREFDCSEPRSSGRAESHGPERPPGLPLTLRVKGSKSAARQETPRGDAIDGVDGENTALLLQSSGTTGRPHIVKRSGPSLDAVARNVAVSVGLRPNDRVLGLIPACHSYGVENLILGPVWAGACVHLCPVPDAATAVSQVSNGGITIFPGVPSMFEMIGRLAGDGCRATTLRRAYSAGANLPLAVFETFERRLGVRIGQIYGMTEIGSVTFNDPDEKDHDPMSVGRPMDGVAIRIVDPTSRAVQAEVSMPAELPGEPRTCSPLPEGSRAVRPEFPCRESPRDLKIAARWGGESRSAARHSCEGEVAVSAPSMLTGYLREEDGACVAPCELVHGFFLTGDLGRLDERRRLTITGRRKLVIDVGGLKVNLLEVEAALNSHEDVRECAVTGVQVSETVARLKAFIVPKDLKKPPAAEALRAYLRSRFSAYKVPRAFELREALPKSATGKLLRHKL